MTLRSGVEADELLGRQGELDRAGPALAQGVLDDVERLQVGVGAAEDLEHLLLRRVGERAPHACLPAWQGEYDVIAHGELGDPHPDDGHKEILGGTVST